MSSPDWCNTFSYWLFDTASCANKGVTGWRLGPKMKAEVEPNQQIEEEVAVSCQRYIPTQIKIS